MRVWRIVAHNKDPEAAISWSLKTGRIALGWGDIDDLRKLDHVTERVIRGLLEREYPDVNNRPHGVRSLLKFWNMKIGDLAIVGAGKGRRSHVVRLVGQYEWNRRGPSRDYNNQRAAVRTSDDANELWQRCRPRVPVKQSIHDAVIRCK